MGFNQIFRARRSSCRVLRLKRKEERKREKERERGRNEREEMTRYEKWMVVSFVWSIWEKMTLEGLIAKERKKERERLCFFCGRGVRLLGWES